MTRPGLIRCARVACIFFMLVISSSCGDDEVGSTGPIEDAGFDVGIDGGVPDDSGGMLDMTTGGPDAEDMSTGDMSSQDMAMGTCGNGVVEAGEECDDGNDSEDDNCLNDCSSACGDGIVQPVEECDTAIPEGDDGACPTSCDDGPSCTVGMLTGSACNATCAYDPVSVCEDDDGCCGFGCDGTNDNDCENICGNNVREPGETCDPIGDCPTACDDGIACTEDILQGDPSTCTAECVFPAIDTCIDDDGCCAPGCTANDDNDCSPTCGNGSTEGNETCDGDCPTSCLDDGDPCTTETLSGDPSQCNVTCTSMTITAPIDGDMCCPSGENANTDSDCTAACGNGVVESGETCDGNCPTTCMDDGNACTVETLSGDPSQCNVMCTTSTITACMGGDGCCPSGCTALNDSDCSATCGNGAIEAGETCDGNCPTSCPDDGDPCTVESLSGSAANCTAQCTSTTITSPIDGDMCCPAGATANNDSDCAPVCGNNAVETGETCDGNCPTSCMPDGDACTSDAVSGSAANCDASCDYDPITACIDGDGCCAPGCDASNDSDCTPVGVIDPASTITTTSSCLTAGTGAQAAVVVTLVDTNGDPVTGANVTMSTTSGSLGSVVEDSGEYVAILTPPLTMAGSTTITVTADGVQLNTQPTVTFESPFTDLEGGAGGCPLDGNVRVRVVDSAGTPLPNAYVMLETLEDPAAYIDTYGGAANAANTARTDSNGYAEFTDFGGNLTGTVTVTGVQNSYHYTTIVDGVSSDYILPVELVNPMAPTGTYTGALTPLSAPTGDPIELGVMIPDLQLENIANFSLDSLLADNKCYRPGGSVDDTAIPGNIYIPDQCALSFGLCLQNLPETDYISPELEFGQRKLLGVTGSAPLSAIQNGGIADALTQLTLSRVGVVDRNLNSTGQQSQDITINEALSEDVSCAVSNAPSSTDVFCVTAGDWDSSSNAMFNRGEGRIGITGFKVGSFAGGTLNITDVARAPLQNAFADLEPIGAAASLYLDAASAPSTDVADGVSAIFKRNPDFSTAGGRAMTFDDFFGIPSLSRTGRALTRGSVANAGGTQPTANYTIHTISQDVTTTYTACSADDSERVESYTLWKIWAPESSSTFDLPLPPSTFPRGSAGTYSGLVDPATTVANDEINWLSLTIHEGLRGGGPAFVWSDLLFADFRRYATHVGANSTVY